MTTTRPTRSALSRGWLYVVLAGAGAVAHAIWARDLYSSLSRFLAWALLVLLLWTVRGFLKRGYAAVPIVPMVVLQYYVLYGAAQFSQTSMVVMGRPYVPQADSVEGAMLLAVGACLAFVGSTTLARRWSGEGAGRIWRAFPNPDGRWRTPVTAYAVASVAFGYFTLMAPEFIPVAIRNIATVGLNPYLGLALVLLQVHRHGGLRLRILALLLVLAFAGITMTSSMMEPVIVSMYVVFVAAWLWGPGIRLRWGVAALSLFLVLNPAKYALRQANRGQAPGGVAEIVANWQSALANVWTGEPDIADTAESATARLSGIIALAQGVEWIPDVVPYQSGRGFGIALQYFIPRVLWPDKPSISDLINNRYALAFGLSSEEGLRTSTFGIMQPLDGYWDFGVAGAIGYSAVFGLFIGWTFRERKGATTAEGLVALVFSSWFFQSLAALQFLLASLVSLFVGVWVALKTLEFAARAGVQEVEATRRRRWERGIDMKQIGGTRRGRSGIEREPVA